MDPERDFLTRALARLEKCMVYLAVAGAVAASLYRGWTWGAGFLLGAAASYLNFIWLKRTANSLGEAAAGRPPRARVAVALGLRYALLAVGAYVIVNLTSINLTAALIGLFVSVAAVILEILFELAIS